MSLSQSSSVSDGDADFIAKLVASCERAEQAPLATPAPKPMANRPEEVSPESGIRTMCSPCGRGGSSTPRVASSHPRRFSIPSHAQTPRLGQPSTQRGPPRGGPRLDTVTVSPSHSSSAL